MADQDRDLIQINNIPQEVAEQRAIQLEGEIIQLKNQVNHSFLELGRILKEFRDNKYYTHLGHDTLTQYLSSSDISISPQWAWAFISHYEVFVLQNKVEPAELMDIDYTKLNQIAPIVKKNPEELDHWLDAARQLRRIDLQKEVKAYKIAKRVEELGAMEAIPSVESVRHVDPVEEMRSKIAENSVDLLLTAPSTTTPRFMYEDVITESKRVLKKDGSLMIFVDNHNLLDVAMVLNTNGFRLVRDIVYHYADARKMVGVNALAPHHELILWATRSENPKYNHVEYEKDVIDMNRADTSEYEWEKPQRLLKWLITMTTDVGGLVLDPFAGIGHVAVAAQAEGRNFVALEKNEIWYKLLLKRLHEGS